MRKLGVTLILIWAGLNALVAAYVTIETMRGAPPPALKLMMREDEIGRVEPRALGVISAQAAIANPLILAVCAFVALFLWKLRSEPWAITALLTILVPVQLFGFVSDHFLGGTNLVANVISSAVLFSGLALTRLARAPGPS